MNKHLLLAPLLLLTALSCAPISEKQCKAGQWYEIGIRDGKFGQSETRVSKYDEECAKVGVKPNHEEWLRGRKDGLSQYCTISHAESLGRNGRALRPVCENSKELIPAHKHGLVYHELEEELDDLKDERDDIRDLLKRHQGVELSEQDMHLYRKYVQRLRRIERQIDRQRRKIRLYRNYSA